jgi:hypothetical protein
LKARGTTAADVGGGRGAPDKRPAPAAKGYLLYSTYFDLWVETRPEWTADFSGGIAFTGLRERAFFIQTVGDNKTVEEDVEARASFRPDIIALVNVRHPDWKGLGAAFGVGLNNDADPRYFLGVSYLFGGKFIFNGGWAGGKVNELPVGQQLHQPPINGDNTLTTPAARFRHAAYVGLGFTFINRENEFKAAFAATQQTTAEEGAPEEPPAADVFEGPYERDGESALITREGDTLKLKVGNAAVETLQLESGLVFRVGSGPRKVKFIRDASNRIAALEYTTEGGVQTFKKKPQ